MSPCLALRKEGEAFRRVLNCAFTIFVFAESSQPKGKPMDSIDDFMTLQQPTALRPLLGLTVLLIEDSRFASEAVRMMCIKSGARIRRADSLHNARRHLAVYRPSVIIVDVGLPDGSGIPLIESVVQGSPRIDVILGISGNPELEDDVLRAGANGFVAKPIANIAAFQSAILRHLPEDRQPPGPRLVKDEVVRPDMVAFHDDLAHVSEVLDSKSDPAAVDYVTQFLEGVARSADDHALGQAVTDLRDLRASGSSLKSGLQKLSDIVRERLTNSGPI